MKKWTYDINLENKPLLIYWLFLIVVVFVGIFFRLKGLGTWPLALDEYYIIKSSENILKHGLPQFPNGGYYERGIVMQYLVAPLIALGVKPELAGRIFSVVSNLLAIPAVYLIAKKSGNRLVALGAIVIFSLSIWEIEFARFARMYAPFQTIFLWYIYFALKDFENKNFLNYKWLLVLSSLSIFIYEGSIFLVLLNFIPLFVLRECKIKYVVFSMIIFIFAIFFNQYSFFTLNSAPPFPPEYLSEVGSSDYNFPIKVPKILLPYSFSTDYFSFLTPIIIIISALFILIVIKRSTQQNFYQVSAVLFLGITAILNQFGLFILFFLVFALWQYLDSNFLTKQNIILLSSVFIVNILYWFIYGISSNEWYSLFNDFSSFSFWGVTKRLLVGFFNYPDNYISLLNYYNTLPTLTIFSGSTILLTVIFKFFYKIKMGSFEYLLSTLTIVSLAASVPNVLYVETRYTFFLIPILIILVLQSVYFLWNTFTTRQRIVHNGFIFSFLLVFIISKDFNLYHLINIDSRNVNYRMIYDNQYKKHLYRRWDILTPTEFIKKNMSKNDLIMINENSMEYYLPKVDYFNFDYKHHAFIALSVEGGKKERWSNSKLIYKNKDLIDLIENRNASIWFLVFPEEWLNEIDFYEKYKANLVSQGVDNIIKVYKFPYMNKPQIN